jgi:peptidoglycan/xylan/chitin deacetylase (PgdA/CDA1 family)
MKYSELKHELHSLSKCYPGFVTRRRQELAPGDLPVFVFHTVSVDELEAQLLYLSSNGYRALSLDEFLDTLAGRRVPGPREVLLTFDDARSSFWLYAFPLLRKYRTKATVFAITGWTRHGTPRPNLEDAWAGRVERAAIDELDPTDAGICSWEELAVMHASGIVTVDSHSHLHRKVFCGTELQSVIRPADDFSPSRAVNSPYLSSVDSPLERPADDYVGLPLMATRALLEEGRAFRVDVSKLQQFQSKAREIVGASDRPLGRSELRQLEACLPRAALEEMALEEWEAEVESELANARAALREQLRDPIAGRTLCLPYTKGGDSMLHIAARLDIEGVFWGVSTAHRINRPGHDPMRIVRLKHDFIWRLHGAGRRSLLSIYAGKAGRRLAGMRPY